MGSKNLERKALFIVGVSLAFLVPVAIKILNLSIPVEFLFAMIMMYLAYIVGSLIHAEEEIEDEVGKFVEVEEEIEDDLGKICEEVKGSGIDLIESLRLDYIRDRVRENRGDIWFFNVPLGRIRTSEGFEVFVGEGVRNPYTKNIVFLLDRRVEHIWREEVEPRIKKLKTNTKIEVKWIKTDKHLAFMMLKGSREVFLFLLEEPFIVETPKGLQTMALIKISNRPDFIAKLEEILDKHYLIAEQ